MKKIKTTGIIVLTLLLLTPFLASSAGAVDVIRNGGFSGGIGEWNINPDIDPTWNPLSDSGVTLSPGGTSYDFNGTVIYQNLNVTGIAGSRFSFSMDLFKSNESDGNTISVILTYVDNANNVHGKKIINPSDVDISSDSANPSRVDGNYTFPDSARKLVKIEIAKDGYGNFKTDNISLTTDAAVDLGPIPAVRGLSVNKGDYGDPITILGGSFGTTQGLVFIGGSSDGVGVTAWSDTSITAIISEPVRSGRVYVIADYVESNIAAESFTVTSPHFTVYVMDHDVKVIKGETAEFVVAVDFKNEFTTTGITFSVTGLNGSIPVFTPSSLATQGGTLLRIDTGGLTAGTHQLLVNAFKDGSATPYCSVPVGLEVITVSDIKLYKYGADSKKIYFDGDAVTLTEQGETRIYFDVIDSHGEIVQTWPSPAVLNSSDPAKLAVYPDKWAGYLIYAVDSGSASLTATAPDGFKKSLSVNNNFTQLITGMGISPGSISNTNTDIVTFSAHSTEPFSWAGYSGDVVLNDDDDIDWSDSNKTVVRTFTVNQAQSSMGTSLFYAGTNSAGRAVPFTITNDSSYSAISGGVRVVDSNLLPYDVEWFDLEFYNIDGTLSFTREAGSPHGGGDFTLGAIEPGTYKVRFVAHGNVKPQWWPNADDTVKAQPLTFTAGGSVDNIYFFAESGSTISGSVAMNNYPGGSILIRAFTDEALTQLAMETKIYWAPGAFTIEGLEPGTYYVMAVLDVNDNGQPDNGEPAANAGVFPVVVEEKSEANVGIITLTKSGQTDFSFTSGVVFSDKSSAVGATVEMAGNSSLSTTTANDGTFTLADIPISTTFSLKVSKEGYANTYTGIMLRGADIEIVGHPFILFTSGEFSDWGVTTGKGIILSKVMNRADGKYIGGATVSCVSGQGKNYTIGYFNEAGFPDKSLTSTSSNGRFFIFDVEEGDRVLVIAQMAGWAFDVRVFMTHGDSVSMGPVFGTRNADNPAAFEPGPLLNTARMGHNAIALPDGRVALFGGHGTGFVSLRSAEVWSPSTAVFNTLNMVYTHDDPAFVHLVDDRYLIAGGSSDLGVPQYATSEIFDPSNNTFTPVGNMTLFRAGAGGAAMSDGRVLIASAWWNHNNAHTYGELFNSDTQNFTAVGPFSVPRAHALVMPTTDGQAVVVGGTSPAGQAGDQPVELFNPATDSISTLQDTLFPGESGWIVSSYYRPSADQRMGDGRYLWLASRTTDGVTAYRLFTFNPDTKAIAVFSTTPELPGSSDAYLLQPVLDLNRGKAHLVGQLPGNNTFSDIALYSVDLKSGTLTRSPNSHAMDYSLNGAGIVALSDGRLMITGGSSDGTNFYPVNCSLILTPHALSTQLKGDVNDDKKINLTDALLALKILSGEQLTNVNLAADVNGDGKIGVAEVIYILRYLAGM